VPKIERMTVVFPQPMADDIRAAVERGEYASTSEAVRDAVRLWSSRRGVRDSEFELLRRAWDEGKRSGVAGPYDMASIIAEARGEARKRPKRAGG
jgi:antitoxin ParD1/3/4